MIAESYEIHGDLSKALRWFNIPFTHGDPLDDAIDDHVLVGRRRVRAALGLPLDRLDQLVEQH